MPKLKKFFGGRQKMSLIRKNLALGEICWSREENKELTQGYLFSIPTTFTAYSSFVSRPLSRNLGWLDVQDNLNSLNNQNNLNNLDSLANTLNT